MNKSNRLLELDLTKTFIIIFSMIGIHSFYDLTSLEVSESVIGNLLNVLGGVFGAPVFMFCLGITLNFTKHQTPTNYFKRGVQLITIGMVLNILRYLPLAFNASVTGNTELLQGLPQIFNVDILQFAGLAFMLFALCRLLKMNHIVILVLSVVLNIAGSLMEGHCTNNYVVNQCLGYFYPTPTCCCFPLANWFIFVAAGNSFSRIYNKTYNIGRFYSWAIPVCGLITAVYMYLTIVVKLPYIRTLQGDLGLYWMNTYDALPTAFGVAPFMIGLFWLIGKCVPDKWVDALSYPSIHINQFYCVSWVWIMWIANIFLFVPKASNDGEFIITWLSIILLTTLSVIVYNRYLKDHIQPHFSRHSKAWTLGSWIVVIVLAFIIFSYIPEPYIMPY